MWGGSVFDFLQFSFKTCFGLTWGRKVLRTVIGVPATGAEHRAVSLSQAPTTRTDIGRAELR